MRFLYLIETELWGRREKVDARNGNTGASIIPVWKVNPSGKGKM